MTAVPGSKSFRVFFPNLTFFQNWHKKMFLSMNSLGITFQLVPMLSFTFYYPILSSAFFHRVLSFAIRRHSVQFTDTGDKRSTNELEK